MKMKIKTFSLPAGRTCPGAMDCKSMAVLKGGKVSVQDGKHCKFRCFSASSEAQYRKTFDARRHNYMALRGKSAPQMAALINSSLNGKGLLKVGDGNAKLNFKTRNRVVRIHVSGDFFCQSYFDAWLRVARENPQTRFYAYTKSIPFWVRRMAEVEAIPNLVLTASLGGRYDALAIEHDLRTAKVCYSKAEARKLKLKIDHDDSLAMKPGKSFALLLHGSQPKGSEASKALQRLKAQGETGYSR